MDGKKLQLKEHAGDVLPVIAIDGDLDAARARAYAASVCGVRACAFATAAEAMAWVAAEAEMLQRDRRWTQSQ